LQALSIALTEMNKTGKWLAETLNMISEQFVSTGSTTGASTSSATGLVIELAETPVAELAETPVAELVEATIQLT
jgi:hypothetical protein